MARSSDPKKAALWERRFRRFIESGLPVARFCVAEHVSESSFYYWQKKLGPQVLRRPVRAKNRDACAEDHGVFRPVTVVSPTCGLVVRLPSGARMEVDAGRLDTILAVVAEMVRADHDLTTRRNMSSATQVIRKRGDVRRC
jgi:hypothetical protein